MFTRLAASVIVLIAFTGLAEATLVDLTNPADVTAFQAGATVNNFGSVAGVTPFVISAYTNGVAVTPTAFVFQVPGAQFSVGGIVGTNGPALYSLSGGIAGDANTASNVLGPVDFSFQTLFGAGAMIEIFFPTKVSKVGVWLNPSLGNVDIFAATTNFAFDKSEPEVPLENYSNLTAGHFVGISRPTADIGGFKLLGTAGNNTGFTIDGLTLGGASPTTRTPEPATLLLLGTGLVGLGVAQYRRRR